MVSANPRFLFVCMDVIWRIHLYLFVCLFFTLIFFKGSRVLWNFTLLYVVGVSCGSSFLLWSAFPRTSVVSDTANA